MSRSWRPFLGVALLALTIGAFAVLTGYSLLRIAAIERDMRIEATQNMLWVISRAEVAAFQLSAAGVERGLGEIDQSALEMHHNVFLSRLALLNDGPQRRRMEELGFAEALNELSVNLPELGGLVENFVPGDAPRLQALLQPYVFLLGRAANKAMVAEWDALGSKLDSSRERLWQLIGSIAGIALAGAALCAHLLMATRDARRRARLLEKEKAFSELLIASSGEGIIAVDRECRCTVWNEAAERLFRIPADKTIGRGLGDASGFFQIDRVEQAIVTSFKGQPAVLLDQPFFPEEKGDPCYLDLRFFSLREGEHIIGSILLVFDVTEQRAAQRQIAYHRNDLEQQVHARTKELDAALKRERAAAELYRNFGAMISHQFRTPLAIVDSALQRLMRRSNHLTAAEIMERTGRARHAIFRMTGLIESTLDAARLDAGQIEVRALTSDFGQIVTDVCNRQTEQTPEKQITVELPDKHPILAHCDPVHAENILVNLLSNAVKYSPPETLIAVRVACNADRVECALSNQGSIDLPSEREAVFERYYRGSNSEGRPGIGIGLYMARALARMQCGDLRLEPGNETGRITFTLVLPQARAEDDATVPSLLVESV
ncbi:PAS domain-containing sensor histidine kinase [Chelativorans sp. Marseille-P2723]|uniref:sensor histidine kinase n=1 Tax=Chelativorans sp. Marseille-P2723 TaxID=2709133 RepID=UPI00156FEBBD|nr:PAS domain-containing sensor histidine kinase [Chelativorans sp. Marseille-P2723]